MKPRLALLIIDPQIDFCDPAGALYVPGAETDMQRLAAMIRRLRERIDAIHVTLDSHHLIHIAHPIFWQDEDGRHPPVFTTIKRADVETGRWRATRPELADRALDYVRRLAENGRYELTIWPPHCLIGSRGHAVFPALFAALQEWEEQFARVDFVIKGSNLLTEHYSAIQADVPDPSDPATQTNKGLIERLRRADLIAIAGEARTHCVASTVRDIVSHLDSHSDAAEMPGFVLLTDAMSDIPGFEARAEGFMKEMTGRGMQVSTTAEFLV